LPEFEGEYQSDSCLLAFRHTGMSPG
jgi:hypothetical protein